MTLNMYTSANGGKKSRDTSDFGIGQVTQPPFNTTTAAFAHYALSHPSEIAVCDLSEGGAPRQLTYGELAVQAQAVAGHLRSIGVQPDQRIPLVVKRSCEMIVGIFAILLCGAQYVPLDGGVVPESTLRHALDQSGSNILVCTSTTESRIQNLFPGAVAVNVEQHVGNDAIQASGSHWIDLATPSSGCYVIYTSGQYMIYTV